jgi:hypothetical protein
MSHRLRSSVFGVLTTALLLSGCTDAPAAVSAPVEASPELSIARRGLSLYVTSFPRRDTLESDATLQLLAAGIDTRGRLITNASMTWSSSDDSRAVVSTSGRVTAKAASGLVTIYAKSSTMTGSKVLYIKGTIPEPPAAGTPPPAPPTSPEPPPATPPTPPAPTPPAPTPPAPTPPAPTPPAPTPPVPPTPVPPAPDVSQTWTYCATAPFNWCRFTGLREVRLVGPNGASVKQMAFGQVECGTYAFGDQNPAPGQTLRCEYGSMMTTTLANPSIGNGLPSNVTVPLGSPGSGARLSRPDPYNTPRAVDDGMGAFRTTCEVASFQFNDPIVFPGRSNAAHLHMFLGNTAIDANSSNASLVSSGNSTCRGGALNRSAYWTPAMYDSRTGAVQIPTTVSVYYKTGYNFDVTQTRTPPVGLRMIAGDQNATAAQQSSYFACTAVFVPLDGMIPNCPVGDELQFNISFPQCWDGVNLDSPDHRSHMAYPIYRNYPQRSSCPPSHPVLLPNISVLLHYPVKPGDTPSTWRLTSDKYSTSIRGGLSAHADWMNGWDQPTLNKIVTLCLNRGLDCGIGNLGDGTTIY